MYCKYCGKNLDDTALFCDNCGARIVRSSEGSSPEASHIDPQFDFLSRQRSFGIAFLTFMIPILGLILYFVWKDSKPGIAISAAKGAIVGVSLNSPIAGLIFFLAFRKGKPELSRAAGIAAIVGLALVLILTPFYMEILAELGGAIDTAMLSLTI